MQHLMMRILLPRLGLQDGEACTCNLDQLLWYNNHVVACAQILPLVLGVRQYSARLEMFRQLAKQLHPQAAEVMPPPAVMCPVCLVGKHTVLHASCAACKELLLKPVV